MANSGRQRGGQPGNLNALKHGFYSAQFRQRENLDLEAMLLDDLHSEIALMRVFTRRLVELANGVETLDQAMEVLSSLGMASVRLASMLRVQRMILGNGDQATAQAISKALAEVVKELGITD